MEEAKLMYNRETSRSDVSTILNNLYYDSPYDYKVMGYYFTALKRRKSIRAITLPYQFVQRQIETEHKLYQTKPGQELPPSAGVYYVCKNCGKLKTSIHPYSNTFSKEKKNSLCSEGICIDVVNGQFTCVKASSKNNPKKRNSSNDIVKDLTEGSANTYSESKKAAKHKRKSDVMTKCPHVELIPTNLLGMLLITDKGLVIKCPECGTVTTLSRDSYKDSGCIFSCGCFQLKEDKVIRCRVCNRETKDPVYKIIYDDLAPNRGIRPIPLCPEHKSPWISQWNQFLELSFVKKCIREELYSKRMANGDRITLKREKKRKMDTVSSVKMRNIPMDDVAPPVKHMDDSMEEYKSGQETEDDLDVTLDFQLHQRWIEQGITGYEAKQMP